MKNRIKYKIICLIVVIIFCLELIPIKLVYASIDQVLTEYLNTSSDILIVGDSRMRQMCLYGHKDVSYVTVGGGHYSGYDSDPFFSINSPDRVKTIKNYIKKIVKKQGDCIVVIVPTVNDYTGRTRRLYKCT